MNTEQLKQWAHEKVGTTVDAANQYFMDHRQSDGRVHIQFILDVPLFETDEIICDTDDGGHIINQRSRWVEVRLSRLDLQNLCS